MASKGETVKYVIDADTSGFVRGMAESDVASAVAGRNINKNLTKTAKSSENNFKDIRKNAQTAASQIRNFGLAFEAFNVTSAVIGITALSGAVLELSGAIAAAGSTATILLPAFVQGSAVAATYQTGISGLSDAFKALAANDPKKWADAMNKLGPAAQGVARSAGAIYNSFRSIQLNTQSQLFSGIGDIMLKLGSQILPVVNSGLQIVGKSINGAFKQAASLASTDLFRGTIATIFQDTANTVTILSQALAPLLTIFINLYAITRPYVTLIAQWIVTLTKSGAAYISSAKGQSALNLAIQEGLVAIEEIGLLAKSVFGLLVSIFRTSVNAGNALIPTLTGIINSMENWVKSSKGQEQLIALFNFTSLALQAVAGSIGRALTFFFDVVQIIDNLNPAVQTMIVNFLATSLTVRPLVGYLSKLWLAIRVLAVTIFNLAEQARLVFLALGTFSGITLIVAAALLGLAAIIRGPLGGAFLIIGAALAAYVGLSYLLAAATNISSEAFLGQIGAIATTEVAELGLSETNILLATTMYGVAVGAADAATGMGFAARGAVFLETALLPLIALAAGVLVILSMLGVFDTKSKKASNTTSGFSSSLGSLEKAMKGVNDTGGAASDNGLSALNNSLGQTADSAAAATGSLASFDKMNVLTDSSSSGITGLPTVPNLGSPVVGTPKLNTDEFDKALADMQNNFAGLQKNLGKTVPNPFASIGDWITAHVVPAMIIFGVILAGVIAAFLLFGVTVAFATFPLTLIVLGVVALIAIIILLAKNWDAVWIGIQQIASDVWKFLQTVWDGIVSGATDATNWVGSVFASAWNGIVAVWNAVVGFFSNIWKSIQDTATLLGTLLIGVFQLAWQGIMAAFGAVGSFFASVWSNIQNAFGAVVSWFGNVFSSAWSAIQNAFSNVVGFFSGIWSSITSIFGTIGSTIGNAVGNAFKTAVNAVLSFLQDEINGIVNIINGALAAIDKITPGSLPRLSTVTLPRLAKGGIINAPTVAQLGEAGTEAVMPLENNTGWIDQLASKINAANGGGNGQPINLTVQIGEDKVANKIIDLINEKTQMSGRNTILV